MADSTTQMFIGNLPWSIRARHLEIDFGEYGEVTDAFVAYKGRRSRGFGFVTMGRFENPAALPFQRTPICHIVWHFWAL